MKILQLGPYPPPYGGVQTHIVALVDFLRQRGIACDVVNLTRFKRASENGIYYPPHALGVARHLLSHRYDIIHLHIGGRIWPQQLALGLACAVLPDTQLVFTFHSGGYPSSPEGRSAHSRTLRAFVLRRFDALIAVNQEIAQIHPPTGLNLVTVSSISDIPLTKMMVSILPFIAIELTMIYLLYFVPQLTLFLPAHMSTH